MEDRKGESHDVALKNIKANNTVNKLDKNGHKIEGEFEQISSAKKDVVGQNVYLETIVEMAAEDKRLYMRNSIMDIILNPEENGISKDDAQEYRDYINDSMETMVEIETTRRTENTIETKLAVFAVENKISISEIDSNARY